MRLIIIGSLGGQFGAASQIAIQRGAKVQHSDTIDAALAALRAGHGADLAMIDVDMDIRYLVESLKSERINLPVVACGVGTDARAAVAALRAGAKEYLPLPPQAELRTVLTETLPQRLAQSLAPEGIMADQRDRDLETLATRIKAWTVIPDGTEGYAKAEVTLGGIDTNELSSKTMEAKRVPGLYAIGEAVDVTGWLGGYNFQWAWASAAAAGQVI